MIKFSRSRSVPSPVAQTYRMTLGANSFVAVIKLCYTVVCACKAHIVIWAGLIIIFR